MKGDMRVRHIQDGDWEAIVSLESDTYAGLGLSEGRTALQARAEASPGTCFVLSVGSRLAGYLLALPYPVSRSPELGRVEGTTFTSRNLHLHDIVIAQSLRGRGLGQRLVRHLIRTAQAREYEGISLVAVGTSERFWAARGFAAHPEIVFPGSYGTKAVYMSKAMSDEVS